MQAALALHDNQLHVAEPLLKAYLKRDPFDARAIRMLAELAGRIGRYGDAEALLRRAVELAPGFTAARANLALVLYRQNRAPEALTLLDEDRKIIAALYVNQALEALGCCVSDADRRPG